MTQFLPPNLLALFAPRDPVQYLAPVDKLPHDKKTVGYSGLGGFLDNFEDPADTPPPTRVETRDERRERKRREKQEQVAYRLEQDIALWDPTSLPNGTLDPFKTLFIARINYDTSESKLRREFEVHGAIKKIVMVHSSKTGKPRGYAFIEYEHEPAYKHADGKKLDGRRVLVDVERSRTVKGWLPRRLGGGLGGTRRGGPDVNVKYSGREDNERMSRGGGGGGGGGGGDRRRSRSRDRGMERDKRRRSRSRERVVDRGDRGAERKRRRSRSRSRDRGERRKHRSRSPRDRRDRRDRGDRERRERRDRTNGEDGFDPDSVRVKEEPADDYPEYPPHYAQNPPLKDEDKKPRNLQGVPPPPPPPLPPPPPPPPSEPTNGSGRAAQHDGEVEY